MHGKPWHGLAAIATFSSYALANPFGHWNMPGNASVDTERLMARDTTEFDQTDLSFIKRMAALGDSYSAGIGAGGRLGTIVGALDPSNWACSRYDHAYPYLVHTDDRLGDEDARTFQFMSCSGAVISNVVNDQIPNISGDQQLILLSAGGNDVELSNILNQCIFQWAVFNPTQVNVAKTAALENSQYTWAKTFDWESIGRGCDGQLARTKQLIAADAFSKSLDSVISAAKKKLGSDYAKFFAEDLSSACDSVSWSTWIYKSYNMFQDTQKLTKDHRKIMNDLVDAVNSKIVFKFVDYDPYVGKFKGRFCESGVDESTVESNTRTGLMFYELNTWDPLGRNPWKRSQDNPLEGTFEGDMNILAQITLLMDPDAKLTDQALISGISADSLPTSDVVPFSTAAVPDVEIPNILPDGYGRVFHPQILLHGLIAERVIYEIVNKNEQDNGFPAIPEKLTFDSCPNFPSSNSSNGQQIAVASYINPLADPAAWDRLINYPTKKMPILVANVVNGPDSAVDKTWADVIDRASASGKTVLGYVRTGYLGVSAQKFTTRLGSGSLADWTAQIEEDIDMWYTLYGSSMGGIFFDEGWPECGDNDKYVDLYKYINDYTKRAHPGAYTVLNPGSPMASCFEDTMDTLLTFELSYDAYMNSYTPNDWTAKDPRKIWHIVYSVPESAVGKVTKLAKERGAGFIQLTDDTLPNPYDTLSGVSYVKSMMGGIKGGSLLNNPASPWTSGSTAAAVSGLSASTSDYTSAKLSWDAASDALGYHVYLGDKLVASVPSSMTAITIGGLGSGASHAFHVSAVGGGGHIGTSSNTVTVKTKSLPNGKTITKYHSSPGADSTTIQADILVPYAFIRLYIWSSVGCEFDTDPGWSVNFKIDEYVCTHYMVEGTTLYKYSGTLPKGSTAPPWAWSEVGPITLDITKYTYTWTLPLGTSKIDTSKFVIQAQGYNPLTNVFEPDPSAYDCKGSSMCTTPDLLKWCDHAVNTLQRYDDPFYHAVSEWVLFRFQSLLFLLC
ncbi:fibronectin type III domain protein [Aspergillus campestris IBT 28561]|uniref:Fibronectin type III domain protein n=1 Tax=Aspergillus campestris (strain IBT 28561) TaxID=1392248 RepID=A0A2I1D2M8_ASPC2|nr:fibronectin type III domain protein [Aspergillus campestris IBT 28561]PKY04114.1 fibronectin type III domain protein [Aspergillus campestris IBT 28561]